MSAPKRPRTSSLKFKYIIKSTVGFETVEAPPKSAFSAVVLKAQFVKENKIPDGWRWAFYCEGSVVPWDAPMESYGGNRVIEAVLEDLQLFTIVPRQSGRMYKYEFLDKLLLLIKYPDQRRPRRPNISMLFDYRTAFRALAYLMQELDGQRRVAYLKNDADQVDIPNPHTIIVPHSTNQYAFCVKAYDEDSKSERWYRPKRGGLEVTTMYADTAEPEIILWCAVKAARSRLLQESIGEVPKFCDVSELLLALTMYGANRHGADLTVCYRGGSSEGRDVMQDVRTGFPYNAYFLVNNRLLRPREFVERAARVKFRDLGSR